jgi:uncharacterized protein YbjT (DUF2867 family)
MPKAFVVGATGYTGREVVRALMERGVDTVAHVRPDSSVLPEWRTRFEKAGAKVDSTPWEADAMRRTMETLHPDLVFALLGTTRARARTEGLPAAAEGYAQIDYGLSALLLRAVVDANIRPRFVYLSALGVRTDTSNPYLAVRWRLEQELVNSGIPYTIARPSFITGPNRDEFRPVEWITAAVIDGVLTVAGLFGADLLRERYRSTSNVVLASALARLALDPTAENTIAPSETLR